MSTFQAACPHCGSEMAVPTTFMGRGIACNICKGSFSASPTVEIVELVVSRQHQFDQQKEIPTNQLKNVQYDPSVIQTFANSPYSRANSIIQYCTFIGFVIGGIAGFKIGSGDLILMFTCFGALFGTLVGLHFGEQRAFALRANPGIQNSTQVPIAQIIRNPLKLQGSRSRLSSNRVQRPIFAKTFSIRWRFL